MRTDDCTVLVSSCDGYADIWEAFFTLLERRWPDRPFPLTLNTETLPAPAGVRALHTPQPACWTRRLQNALRQLETPFVLLLLDDFFCTAPVDTTGVLRALDHLRTVPEVACISFFPTTGNREAAPLDGYELRPQDGLYRFNAQAGIWRRERLIAFLDADENAWEWENKGNRRSFAVPDAFYSRSADVPPVFAYDFMQHGLIGGKWFPATRELFAAEGIAMDFSRRGFYDPARRALLPSVASAFELDSVLYPDTGTGFAEQTALTAPTQKGGAFCQHFALPAGTRQVRWDPSTHDGFALEGLQLRLTAGKKRAVPVLQGGNAADCGAADGVQTLCFLQTDPNLTYRIPRSMRGVPCTLTVTGTVRCPLTDALLDRALAAPPVRPPLWERCRRRLLRGR